MEDYEERLKAYEERLEALEMSFKHEKDEEVEEDDEVNPHVRERIARRQADKPVCVIRGWQEIQEFKSRKELE